MNKQRYYIATQGNDDEAYRKAIKLACMIADNDLEIKRVVILIHTKQTTGWFERLYGREIEKKLFTGTLFKDCKTVFKFETKKTYKDGNTPSEIVITCGLDSDDVLPIDNFYSVKVIIAIPWLRDGLKKWIQTWTPTELSDNQNIVAILPSPTCIVKKAMAELTESVNMTTGISQPFDNEQAKTYILALHKYEPSLEADIVGAYLVRVLNWNTDHAKEVEVLIDTLNSGKHFHGGKRKGLKQYYNRWHLGCK